MSASVPIGKVWNQGHAALSEIRSSRPSWLAGGARYRHLVKQYRLQEIHKDLDTVLDFEKAAKTIDVAKGANDGIGEWSEDGCRELAQQATSSFLQPAKEMLQAVEVLVR